MINSAYDNLTVQERETVDQFVKACELYAQKNNELLIWALNRPIPPDVVNRSRGILEKPLVLAAIHEKIRDLANDQDLAAKRVLREQILIATSNMQDFIDFDINGKPRITVDNATREKMAAVKTLKINNTLFGQTIELQLHSKEAALNNLSKMMGLDQPDNPIYLAHIAKPSDIKPLAATTLPAEAENAYIELLEAIK